MREKESVCVFRCVCAILCVHVYLVPCWTNIFARMWCTGMYNASSRMCAAWCVYVCTMHTLPLRLSPSHTHTHTLLHTTHTQTHMPAGCVAGGWTGSFSTSAKDDIASVSVGGALLVRVNMSTTTRRGSGDDGTEPPVPSRTCVLLLRAKWFPSFFMLPRNTLDIFNVCMLAATAHKWWNRRTDCAWDCNMPLTIDTVTHDEIHYIVRVRHWLRAGYMGHNIW
jgi:hypothetical protein